MKRVVVKEKKLRNGDKKNTDLIATMFQNIMDDKGDPAIIAEKNVKLRTVLRKMTKVCSKFAVGPFFKTYKEYEPWSQDFKAIGDMVEKLNVPTNEYKEIKTHNVIRQLIVLCAPLNQYKQFLSKETLTDIWINSHPGLTFLIFSGYQFDIKHIWDNVNVPLNIRNYVLQTIAYIYQQCYDLSLIITSPDIDVKQFSKIILDSIDQIKKIPELSRCKDALNKINKSIDLLESNFPVYHKNMITSGNPNIIIEKFIVDVSNQADMTPTLMRQFNTIISFYQKRVDNAKPSKKNKQVHQLLNMVNRSTSAYARENNTDITPYTVDESVNDGKTLIDTKTTSSSYNDSDDINYDSKEVAPLQLYNDDVDQDNKEKVNPDINL